MNKEVRRLVFEFNPTDPKVTRAELEEAVKCLQRAIKHPLETIDGVFECPVPSCNKINKINKLVELARNQRLDGVVEMFESFHEGTAGSKLTVGILFF